MNETKKSAYVCRSIDNDEGSIVAVVAESASQAKMLGMYFFDCEYIDIRVRKDKNVDVSHLPLGEINDMMWALEKGLYGDIRDQTCPRCHAIGVTVQYDNGFFCDECEDEYYGVGN